MEIRGIVVGDEFTHYKKEAPYKVVGFSQEEKDCSINVLYVEADDSLMSKSRIQIPWSRPIGNFLENVEVDGKLVKRFERKEK